jgi:hypothetical protein
LRWRIQGINPAIEIKTKDGSPIIKNIIKGAEFSLAAKEVIFESVYINNAKPVMPITQSYHLTATFLFLSHQAIASKTTPIANPIKKYIACCLLFQP